MATSTTASLNNIKGIITNEGLSKSIEAQAREGWKIYPRAFACSEILGLFDTTRDTSSMYETWYEAPISGVVVQGVNTLEFLCTIPPGSTADNKFIREIYVTALDEADNLFLLGLGQIEGDVQYNPGGATKLRILISIQNVNISGLYEFKYTQATEIEDHNNDPNAHPDIRALLTGAASSTIINNNYFAQPGDTIFVNSQNNAVKVSLPVQNLVLGTRVTVVDVGLAGATPGRDIIVARNGNKIDDREEDFRIDTSGGCATFWWYPGKSSWMVDIGGRFYRPAPSTLQPGTLRLSQYLDPSQLFQTGSFTPEYPEPGTITGLAGQVLFINTTSKASTVKLPPNPSSGERVQIIDARGNAQTYNIRVSGNGRRINGTTNDYVININNASVTFVWDDANANWCVDYGGISQGQWERRGEQVTPARRGFNTTRSVVPNNPNEGWLGVDDCKWGYLRANNGWFQQLAVAEVIQGTALKARYADLAENYVWTDSAKPLPGTLVTLDVDSDNNLACRCAHRGDTVLGVISTNPGFILGFDSEEDAEGQTTVPLALTGRVPVRVTGAVKKGQPLYFCTAGVATANDANMAGVDCDGVSCYDKKQMVGIALESSADEDEKTILCFLK